MLFIYKNRKLSYFQNSCWVHAVVNIIKPHFNPKKIDCNFIKIVIIDVFFFYFSVFAVS